VRYLFSISISTVSQVGLVYGLTCISDGSKIGTFGQLLGSVIQHESRAVARKPRDTAAVLFGLTLKFTDSIHYKFKSSQASKARLRTSELETYWRKTGFNAKWPSRIIQGHAFWSQRKGDKGIPNANVGLIR